MHYGASFSHPHLKSLDIDPQKAIKEFKDLNFKWIRLGCYWSEIEKEEGKFDFEELEDLIKFCEKNKINVVLTVGMKAPRWPEYYIPNWVDQTYLHKRALEFVKTCISHFKKYKAIKVWQAENEPLDPSGPNNNAISLEILKKEVELIKKLDKRKIMVTFWGNDLTQRSHYKKVLDWEEVDIVGIDIYLKHANWITKWLPIYFGPKDLPEVLKNVSQEIKQSEKEFWIAELQAEPWEPSQELHESKNPPSFKSEDFEKNLNYALSLNPDTIFWWGFEYWLMRKEKGDLRYWRKIKV